MTLEKYWLRKMSSCIHIFVALGGALCSSNTIRGRKIVVDEKFDVKTSGKNKFCATQVTNFRPAVNRQPGYRRGDS